MKLMISSFHVFNYRSMKINSYNKNNKEIFIHNDLIIYCKVDMKISEVFLTYLVEWG